MEPVRLVIWDLDETFWRGTVDEGGISAYSQENHDLVVELARRGIMSSICSKNDFGRIKTILTERGLWDYFIFPSINWEAKGPRIAEIVANVQLRAETVLFIDDNAANLAQAAAAVPGLQIADPAIIPTLWSDSRCKGKDDSGLTRLAQYKVLEKKQRDKSEFAEGGHEFLRNSDIRVAIETDILGHIDRAVELINRTNQLNFTKRRLPDSPAEARAALARELERFDVVAGLVSVSDRYGDYGFVGFYLLTGHWGLRRLVHFAFSCRTLGMGVEQFVYNRLNRPAIKIVGEVLNGLDQPVDWITLASPNDTRQAAAAPAAPMGEIRLRGGCDLEILGDYLGLDGGRVAAEVVHWKNDQVVRLDHSSLLVLALAGADGPTQAAIEALGLPAAAYSSDFLRPAADNDVLILSNLGDAIACVYRHKSLSFHLPLDIAGIGHRDVTSLGQQQCEALFSELNLPAERRARLHEIVALVKQNYEFVGRLGEAAVKDNLRAIFARVPAAAKFFVLLPSDKSFKDGAPVFHQDRTRLREWIIEAAAPFSSVTLIDSNEFINHPDDVPGSPGHYGRAVYLKICNRVRQQLGR